MNMSLKLLPISHTFLHYCSGRDVLHDQEPMQMVNGWKGAYLYTAINDWVDSQCHKLVG